MRKYRGRYEKKPANSINWSQTIVNALMSFLVGLILKLIDWLVG